MQVYVRVHVCLYVKKKSVNEQQGVYSTVSQELKDQTSLKPVLKCSTLLCRVGIQYHNNHNSTRITTCGIYYNDYSNYTHDVIN